MVFEHVDRFHNAITINVNCIGYSMLNIINNPVSSISFALIGTERGALQNDRL